MPDYAGMYQDYWIRPDRWQSHSFDDAETLVDQILTLGTGTMLDVGCGMGGIVLVCASGASTPAAWTSPPASSTKATATPPDASSRARSWRFPTQMTPLTS